MRVIFRVDASLQIGTGHVMRCLTLANALKARGANCTFICRAHPGHLGTHIEAAGHTLHLLPQGSQTESKAGHADLYADWLGCSWEEDARQTKELLNNSAQDWLVVDHYSLDTRWETELRSYTKQLMVIDDLANRAHNCDLLLDQNLGRQSCDYAALVPRQCKCLIGPAYALLRPEFAEWREYSLKRREQPQLKQILVTLGGVDKDNITGQVLDALSDCPLPADCRVVIVMGPHAPWLDKVCEQAKKLPWHSDVKVGVKNMAELMANSDLAVGAAGSTSWERCALGLPTILLIIAENQYTIGKALDDVGAAHVIDDSDLKEISLMGNECFKDENLLMMKDKAASITDGLGAFQVTNILSGRVR